jgi:hypothetical protein
MRDEQSESVWQEVAVAEKLYFSGMKGLKHDESP